MWVDHWPRGPLSLDLMPVMNSVSNTREYQNWKVLFLKSHRKSPEDFLAQSLLPERNIRNGECQGVDELHLLAALRGSSQTWSKLTALTFWLHAAESTHLALISIGPLDC